jgi:hypothetical protein
MGGEDVPQLDGGVKQIIGDKLGRTAVDTWNMCSTSYSRVSRVECTTRPSFQKKKKTQGIM